MATVPVTHTMVDYKGPVTFETIESLLNQLRGSEEFMKMGKPARKRLYGTFVESVDNIRKYAAGSHIPEDNSLPQPSVSVKKVGSHYLVSSGNLVDGEDVDELTFKLERINQLDRESLKTLYEEIINEESEADERGAGLGLITMALRTDQGLHYRLYPVDEDHSYLEIQLIINE